MEELFRKQAPVKPTNSGCNGNASNGSKDTSQVDGTNGGKKKDGVSTLSQIIKSRNLML